MAKKEFKTVEELYEGGQPEVKSGWFIDLIDNTYKIDKVEKVSDGIYKVHLAADKPLYPTYAPSHKAFRNQSDLKETTTKAKEKQNKIEEDKALQELPKKKRTEAKEDQARKAKKAPAPSADVQNELDELLNS